MLQREGLVISEPNRPVRIAPLSQEDFEELVIMRIALETVAIHITVPTLTSSDFADLEGFMAQMEHYQKAGDQAGFHTPHRALHHRPFQCARARRLSENDGRGASRDPTEFASASHGRRTSRPEARPNSAPPPSTR